LFLAILLCHLNISLLFSSHLIGLSILYRRLLRWLTGPCFVPGWQPLQQLSPLLYVCFLPLPFSFYDIAVFLILFAFKGAFLVLIIAVLFFLIV